MPASTVSTVPPVYLVDSSGQQWLLHTLDNGQLDLVQVSGVSAAPSLFLNDDQNLVSWILTVVPNPPPPGYSWGDLRTDRTVYSPLHPTSILLNSPGGTVYALQIDHWTERLETTSISLSGSSCVSPLSSLGPLVQDRLEEPRGDGIFWSLRYEIYSALVEAMNDLMLLVGRPTVSVSRAVTLTPSTVWQPMPAGLLGIADIWGARGQLRKVTLFDLDYSQSSWGADWENDTDPLGPTKWAPIGLGLFAVHPAPSVPQIVTVDAVPYPYASSTWPPDGTSQVPFEENFFPALEIYASVYARLKEGGAELEQSLPLYAEYLKLVSRMSEIQDRRDKLIFAPPFGLPAGLQSRVKR